MRLGDIGFPQLTYQPVSLPSVPLVVCAKGQPQGNIYVWNTYSLRELPSAWAACFYTEDWRFSRYLKSVKAAQMYFDKFDYVFQPDFSVYYDQPLIDQWWRTWIGKRIAATWQRSGFRVIPSLVLGSKDNFDAAIYGIPKGQVFGVQLQANDQNTDQDLVDRWTVLQAIKKINPPFVLVYATEDRLVKLELDGYDRLVVISSNIHKLRNATHQKKNNHQKKPR